MSVILCLPHFHNACHERGETDLIHMELSSYQKIVTKGTEKTSHMLDNFSPSPQKFLLFFDVVWVCISANWLSNLNKNCQTIAHVIGDWDLIERELSCGANNTIREKSGKHACSWCKHKKLGSTDIFRSKKKQNCFNSRDL